eukprot:GEMP01014854.1.p1 GENE.GEMP01014854.1~~GEMP01014854.1.p1  ORF type:complete len:760 (+),score=147.04 GEMP01014854.1:22-2280(+)
MYRRHRHQVSLFLDCAFESPYKEQQVNGILKILLWRTVGEVTESEFQTLWRIWKAAVPAETIDRSAFSVITSFVENLEDSVVARMAELQYEQFALKDNSLEASLWALLSPSENVMVEELRDVGFAWALEDESVRELQSITSASGLTLRLLSHQCKKLHNREVLERLYTRLTAAKDAFAAVRCEFSLPTTSYWGHCWRSAVDYVYPGPETPEKSALLFRRNIAGVPDEDWERVKDMAAQIKDAWRRNLMRIDSTPVPQSMLPLDSTTLSCSASPTSAGAYGWHLDFDPIEAPSEVETRPSQHSTPTIVPCSGSAAALPLNQNPAVHLTKRASEWQAAHSAATLPTDYPADRPSRPTSECELAHSAATLPHNLSVDRSTRHASEWQAGHGVDDAFAPISLQSDHNEYEVSRSQSSDQSSQRDDNSTSESHHVRRLNVRPPQKPRESMADQLSREYRLRRQAAQQRNAMESASQHSESAVQEVAQSARVSGASSAPSLHIRAPFGYMRRTPRHTSNLSPHNPCTVSPHPSFDSRSCVSSIRYRHGATRDGQQVLEQGPGRSDTKVSAVRRRNVSAKCHSPGKKVLSERRRGASVESGGVDKEDTDKSDELSLVDLWASSSPRHLPESKFYVEDEHKLARERSCTTETTAHSATCLSCDRLPQPPATHTSAPYNTSPSRTNASSFGHLSYPIVVKPEQPHQATVPAPPSSHPPRSVRKGIDSSCAYISLLGGIPLTQLSFEIKRRGQTGLRRCIPW